MSVYIHHISTQVPSNSAPQQEIREFMKARLGDDRKTQAIIHRIYSQSGIGKRHSVIGDMLSDEKETFFMRSFRDTDLPRTAERNTFYKEASIPLFTGAAEKALEGSGFKKEDITHVITVSCTGFFAPGPDIEVVQRLDLPSDTERTHIGFMGCYAVFPALKLGRSICNADPEAVVLVVSAELCTLHVQNSSETDNLLAASVFADGAAAALLSARTPTGKALSLDTFATALAPEGEKDMAWTIGDTGFNMVLSSYVPDIIGNSLHALLHPLFSRMGIGADDISRWAIHPGGRAILDKVEESFDLKPPALDASRTILREYGNMSSATILFVLENLLNSDLDSGTRILPMAFGPGLTIETGILTYHSY